jgi:hypothetical protein
VPSLAEYSLTRKFPQALCRDQCRGISSGIAPSDRGLEDGYNADILIVPTYFSSNAFNFAEFGLKGSANPYGVESVEGKDRHGG